MNVNAKSITVVAAGVGGDPSKKSIHYVEILPGTTPKDVIKHLDLGGNYTLSDGHHPPFHLNENLYPLLPDGAELKASPRMEAGIFF